MSPYFFDLVPSGLQVDRFWIGCRALDTRGDAPIRVQLEPAVTRCALIEREILTTGPKLNTGRGRRQQEDIVAEGLKLLMHVPPKNTPNLRMAIDDREELDCVVHGHRVQPRAAHGNGLMVKTHQRVRGLVTAEVLFKRLELIQA